MLSQRISGGNAGGEDITKLPKSSPQLFVVSGPSGVGKDTIVDQLKVKEPNRHYAITVTTRDPRPGEENEVHYHFRTEAQFQDMLAHDDFLEWAKVYDHYYGVPKFELRDAIMKGLDVMVKVDVQGAATIKGLIPQAILIFLAPYAMSELLQRAFRRRTETGFELELRKQAAQNEMDAMTHFDYLVINKQGELTKAVSQIESIIATEKSRVHPALFTI